MKSVEILPDGYIEAFTIDLQKNKKLALIVNGLAAVIGIALALVAHFLIVPITKLFAIEPILDYILRFAVIMIGSIVYIILHEAVHGIFIWTFTGTMPSFGFDLKSGMAYAAFAMLLGALAVVTRYVNFDYGFTGIIAPLFAAWPGDRWDESKDIKPPSPGKAKKLLYFAYGIMLTACESAIGWIQLFALLTIPLLWLYNGKPGSRRLKYFFYIFYPVHLLLIELTAMIIE